MLDGYVCCHGGWIAGVIDGYLLYGVMCVLYVIRPFPSQCDMNFRLPFTHNLKNRGKRRGPLRQQSLS